jgi:hypothetical protein
MDIKSVKKENVFKAAGLNEVEVRQWQKEKDLGKLADKPLCQLYNRVVLKKTLKAPFPIFTVKAIWDRIEEFNSGTRDRPASNKMFVGIKEATVVGLHNTIRYSGCPKCLKGHKKIGADYCSAHEGGVVELVDLAWNEWLIYSDEDEFIVKMNPNYMHKYTEDNMTGATIWVEGVINLAEDPLMMMVSAVREFEPGELLGGNIEPDRDLTSGREDVHLAGFDAEDEEEEIPEKNPFLDEDEIPTNGSNQEFVNALITEWTGMLEKWAVEPVKKVSVERYILDWIENNYPREFENTDKAKEKLWELVEGTYDEAEDDRIVNKKKKKLESE